MVRWKTGWHFDRFFFNIIWTNLGLCWNVFFAWSILYIACFSPVICSACYGQNYFHYYINLNCSLSYIISFSLGGYSVSSKVCDSFIWLTLIPSGTQIQVETRGALFHESCLLFVRPGFLPETVWNQLLRAAKCLYSTHIHPCT